MLLSPRQRAKSRLGLGSTRSKANSRLSRRSINYHQQFLRRSGRYLAKSWKLLGKIWSLLMKLQLLSLAFDRLDLKSLTVAVISWLLTGLFLTSFPPTWVAGIPPAHSYWPVVGLLIWDIYWLNRGFGLSSVTNWALTLTVNWWLWLRLQNVTTNLWLIGSMGAVFLSIYAYLLLGEKYIFSRKSIRKGILR